MPVIYQEVDLSVCCILHRPGCSPTTQTGKPRHREVKPFSCSNLDERRQGQASVGSRTSPSLRGGHLRKPPPACTALTVSCSPPSPSPPPLLSHDPPPQPSREEGNQYISPLNSNEPARDHPPTPTPTATPPKATAIVQVSQTPPHCSEDSISEVLDGKKRSGVGGGTGPCLLAPQCGPEAI